MDSWRADVMVLTEFRTDLAEKLDGHVVTGGDDWGYTHPPGRHKVMLRSRTPWRDVDTVGDNRLPPGRIVAATTTTTLGDIRVVGVCVPWRAAHVRDGQRNRQLWEEHLAFLDALPAVLEVQRPLGRVVLAGDLNQALPDPRVPAAAREALAWALRSVTTPTARLSCGRRLLDHICLGTGLTAASADVVCLAHAAKPLSDHDASVVDVHLG
jgi:endonuclease/exonuclease/phosphatase family metal-dependent hydrolase